MDKGDTNMSMTKKDFIALANLIRDSRLGNPNTFRQGEILELAEFCKQVNPNFNRERWISYIDGKCGPNGGKTS